MPRSPTTRRRAVVALAATLGSLAGALAAGQVESSDAGPVVLERRPEAPVAVDLADLRADPGAWLGRRVETVVQLAAFDRPWQPWLSRFGPPHFARVEAWADSQLPWDVAAFEDPAPYLFVRAGSTADFVLRHGRAHERFAVTLTVDEQFMAEPWCEIVDARRLTPSINAGAVLHASRAIEQFERDAVELALSELDRALASPLPERARAALVELRDGWTAGDGRR